MSDEQTPQGGAVSAGQQPASASATTPQATPPAKPQEPDPKWLSPRLEQAQRSAQAELLKRFGAEKPEDIESRLKRLEELEAASLSEKERLEKALADLTPKATRAATLEQTVKAYADRELSALNDAQRSAVQALAGDDPARILTAIEQLKPTWQAVPAVPAPAQPVTTSPPAGAPPAAGGTSPIDHKAEFARLQKENPFEAARYRIEHAKHLV